MRERDEGGKRVESRGRPRVSDGEMRRRRGRNRWMEIQHCFVLCSVSDFGRVLAFWRRGNGKIAKIRQ